MRNIFILLLGRKGGTIYSTVIDGVEWYSAAHICNLIGIKDVSSAMREKYNYLELFSDEKRKFRDNNINRHSEVWFVTEKGFWKLMGSSKGFEAIRFRGWVATAFLPGILQAVVNNEEVAEAGYRRLFRQNAF